TLIAAPRSQTSGTPARTCQDATPCTEPPAPEAALPPDPPVTRTESGLAGSRSPPPPSPAIETTPFQSHCLPARRLPALRRRGHAPPASRRTAESTAASRADSSTPGPPTVVS